MKIDLTGLKFNHLTVIKKADEQDGKRVMWVCRCDCGKETLASTNDLRAGHKKSCGPPPYMALSMRLRKENRCKKR